MSHFHLHARKGITDVQTIETSVYDDVLADARRLASENWYVWIFSHHHPAPALPGDVSPPPSQYRTVAELRPESAGGLLERFYGSAGMPSVVGWSRHGPTQYS